MICEATFPQEFVHLQVERRSIIVKSIALLDTEADREVAHLISEGNSLSQIGMKFGVSKREAQDLVSRVTRALRINLLRLGVSDAADLT